MSTLGSTASTAADDNARDSLGDDDDKAALVQARYALEDEKEQRQQAEEALQDLTLMIADYARGIRTLDELQGFAATLT